MADDLTERLDEAVRQLRAGGMLAPRVVVVADPGTVGPLTQAIDVVAAVPYASVPGFPTSGGAYGNACLSVGWWGGTSVAVVPGVESLGSCSLRQATLPVRALRRLGADVLVALGPCVATDAAWSPGDVVLIDDHINLLGDNPLVGPNDEALGSRFPDMSDAYDRALADEAAAAARRAGCTLRRGVYAALTGRAQPTVAECRMLRTLGADVVGGGLVPEVIVARHMDMRVLGLCCVGGTAADMTWMVAEVVGRID